MYRDFGTVFLFIIIGAVLLTAALLLAKILSPSRPSKNKLSTYECGEEAEGFAWVQFNIRYYVIALIFIIFDVEVLFLFPWVVVYKDLGWLAFIEMAIFLLILIIGLIYVWKKGDLNWIKYNVKYGQGRYQKIREREA
ncbi:NADH-quinone oxidoreductase subunit A [bacterium]|nr:NADH-quinone oxidoreductase subunit A [bacterium]